MKDSFKCILRDANLKITTARLSVLSLLAKNKKPFTVEMISQKLRSKKVDQATIYRTIESLLKAKLIGRVDLRRDAVYYELLGNHHHHIVCTKCGVLEDFESCSIEDVSNKILSRSNKFMVINDHSFELFGFCKSCFKNV